MKGTRERYKSVCDTERKRNKEIENSVCEDVCVRVRES